MASVTVLRILAGVVSGVLALVPAVVAVLDAVAATGRPVTLGPSTVEVRDAGGYRLTVRVAEEIVLVGESPCVWPRGTREPGP